MIDRLVDATFNFRMMSFMDAFSGDNQIWMAEEDEEKTAFIMNHSLYCYKVMPYDLKTIGATYQRLVNKVFVDQLEKNMEACIDDMLIKSKSMSQHIADFEEIFFTLRKQAMRLNPTKCVFGVTSRKFFGFIIS